MWENDLLKRERVVGTMDMEVEVARCTRVRDAGALKGSASNMATYDITNFLSKKERKLVNYLSLSLSIVPCDHATLTNS